MHMSLDNSHHPCSGWMLCISLMETFIFFFLQHQHQEHHMHYLRTTGQRQDSGISCSFNCVRYSLKMVPIRRLSSSVVKELFARFAISHLRNSCCWHLRHRVCHPTFLANFNHEQESCDSGSQQASRSYILPVYFGFRICLSNIWNTIARQHCAN